MSEPTWELLGGPTGPQGPQGVQGIQGIQGPAGPDPRRAICGVVESNGVILYGSGFTVSRTAQGHYLITPTVAFSGFPAVVANSYDAGLIPNIIGLTASSFTVRLMNTSAGSNDNRFSFIAMQT